MASVLIVDDEEDIRRLVRAIVETADEDLVVVGEAGTGLDALTRWRATSPDVIVLDERLPDMSGLDAARQILAERPEQSIILFCAYLEDGIAREASRLGVRTCVAKRDVADLPQALARHATSRGVGHAH